MHGIMQEDLGSIVLVFGTGGRTTAIAFAKNVFIDQERKSEVRRRSDTTVVLSVNYASQRSGAVSERTRRAASGKPELLGSGGSMVAKLKLKGIDERVQPGMDSAAQFDSTRVNSPGPDTARIDRLMALS
ncbi:putative 18s rrna sequence [Nephila pilipes]|uniref:Putative 18s rrna sequence n=1 Tax=Nephila pilipes TaxID=299642 RepID=A0A8X6U6Z0_NEPPI|nr:putative 18s rrna sequence [Nephila pilipes]